MVRDGLIRKIYLTCIEMVRRSKERVEVRCSPATLIEIDKLVEQGLFASRSDYLNHVAISDLSERKIKKNIKDQFLNLIKTDNDIRDEIRKI